MKATVAELMGEIEQRPRAELDAYVADKNKRCTEHGAIFDASGKCSECQKAAS